MSHTASFRKVRASLFTTLRSEAVKTGYCSVHGTPCDIPAGCVTIGAEYLDAKEPVIKEKAAVRLARVLDAAFGN